MGVNSMKSQKTSQRATPYVWGAVAIAAEIDRTPRQTFHLLERGHLPARKVGDKWVARREELHAFLSGSGQSTPTGHQCDEKDS